MTKAEKMKEMDTKIKYDGKKSYQESEPSPLVHQLPLITNTSNILLNEGFRFKCNEMNILEKHFKFKTEKLSSVNTYLLLLIWDLCMAKLLPR